MSLANAWVDSYLDALLSAGLSTESARRAGDASAAALADAPASVDADNANIAAKYYVQTLLALDEESIQQAWLRVHARSNVRLAADRDARLEHICWRVWSMRRKAAAAALHPDDGAADSPTASAAAAASEAAAEAEAAAAGGPLMAPAASLDVEELTKLYGAAPGGALRRLSIPPRGGGGAAGRVPSSAKAAAAAELLAESPDEPCSASLTPTAPPPSTGGAFAAALAAGAAAGAAAAAGAGGAPATPHAGPAAAAAGVEAELLGVNLGEGRVPKLYCVLISMHGLVRGEGMELGKDPDTGGQVKYVVELAKALSRHPAVHRVDLLTRLIQDPAVDASYGEPEEALGPAAGRLGGARIVRIRCGPPAQYLRKEGLWPYVREFADNALAHVNATLAALAAAGETCELYDIHGHYADAGEAAALMSFTLGSDMVLTGHSLGRNKLDHLLKSRTMTRREIEATYAMSRRIEAEERSLDAALMVFTSTQQEVKDQWGLYDGYDPALERIIRGRPRRGRHFPVMHVIPPGLDFSNLKIDFSNLKVDCPPDPWEQLAQAQHAAAAAAAASPPPPALAPSPGGRRSRRPSSAAGMPPLSPIVAELGSAENLLAPPPVGPEDDAAAALGVLVSPRKPRSSPFLRDAPPLEPGLPATSPRAPPTPLPPAGAFGGPVGGGVAVAGGGVGPGAGAVAAFEDPPIWQEIFRFLRNPRKPVILAMSRPDAKKNITTLVRVFGENGALRDIANLVLIMGNRKVIDGMAPSSAKVLDSVLKLVDAYDLYGSVAYPKRHGQGDISDIYLLPHHTRGVFVNIALQEPFGLTLIEAAAHGVPIVATTHGGPVDIITTLHNGILVDPTDQRGVSDALLKLLTDPGLWEQYASAGRANINAYSWPSHCIKCLAGIEAEKARAVSCVKTAMRSTYSIDMGELATPAPPAPPPAAPADGGAAADGAGADAADAGGGGLPRLRLPAAALSKDDSAVAPAAAPPLSPRGSPPRNGFSGGGVTAPSPRARGSLDEVAFGALFASAADAAAAAGAAAARGGGPPVMAPKARYVVLLLDSTDTAARLASILAGKGRRALLGAAPGGGAVGVGVASAAPLAETLAMLSSAGLRPRDVDFLVTNCGAQVWYGGPAAAAAGGAGGGGAGGVVADAGWDAFAEARWDKISVRRVLAQMLAQRPLLAGLASAGGGSGGGGRGGGGAAPKITVDTETGAHHLLLTLRAPGGGRPALSPADALAVAARIKKRFRSSGLRTQITAAAEGDGSVALHVTPLRASRALAVRWLAHKHKVDITSLMFVSCARAMAPGQPAHFATSDAEDALGGAQHVVVVPPPAAPAPAPADGAAGGEPQAAAAAAAQLPSGFSVDLSLFTHDGRLHVLDAAKA
ncbi:MAG: hypothetical protein J3K34DRAFT_519144 [Monoraphidium minutum]|nr:MAG: hypothetical protein J3K34DRAFT_519144 [Monoraphidium minutum]